MQIEYWVLKLKKMCNSQHMVSVFTNGVFFSTKKCAFYLKKFLFCVCFLKMFRPLNG